MSASSSSTSAPALAGGFGRRDSPGAVRLYLVRHGRAAAGWDTDPDPPIDDVGCVQAEAVAARLAPLGPLPIVTSPLLRCRMTAEPLAAAWDVVPVVVSEVAEIPSPDGVPMGQRVPWLRAAMSGTWAELGPRYLGYRDTILRTLAGLRADTVVVSHFIAINAVIGAATGDDRLVIASLDNASVTVVEVEDDRFMVTERGHEADTLIR
jgi:broad specificity phosphatase PhoE